MMTGAVMAAAAGGCQVGLISQVAVPRPAAQVCQQHCIGSSGGAAQPAVESNLHRRDFGRRLCQGHGSDRCGVQQPGGIRVSGLW